MTSVAYLVGVLLFLLPFVEIKCNNNTLAENSGIGLALGTDYKIIEQVKTNNHNGVDNVTIKGSRDSGKMYVIALVAMILGIVGLLVSLTSRRYGPVNMIIGALAAILLIALMFQLKSDISDKSKSDEVKVTVNFTVWYYLSIGSFLFAAFLGLKQNELMGRREMPPKNAPQVPIDNPGDQSQFPTYPDESEMER